MRACVAAAAKAEAAYAERRPRHVGPTVRRLVSRAADSTTALREARMTTVAPARTGAMLARGKSKQSYGTPRDFLDAVEARYGAITWDLAATRDNVVTQSDYYFGPASPFWRDALSPDCHWPTSGVNWLNPPFDDIATWAVKCAAWQPDAGARLIMLTPASVGSTWFADHVHGKAMVEPLSPRLTFVGEKHGYPKDLMISVWDGCSVGFEPWRWCERRRPRRLV